MKMKGLSDYRYLRCPEPLAGARHPRRSRAALALISGLVAAAPGARADGELGLRILGSAGLDAGTQQAEGLYVGDRFLYFGSNRLMNRRGDVVPIKNLDIHAYANILGISKTWLTQSGLYVSTALAMPVTNLNVTADRPKLSSHQFGPGNLYGEPIKLGWRWPHLDTVASYGFYAPTGVTDGQGFGQPQWTHQISLGGTFFLDDERGFRVSALSSYNIYQRKTGVDITRGDSVQIQGGLGGRWFGVLDLGVAAYALWQVGDDIGPDLPRGLRDAHERAVGVGPELNLLVPPLRGRLTVRYMWDVLAEARPQGQILVVGFSFMP
jgi:hypothetical protein